MFSRSLQPGPDKNMLWNFGHLLLIPPPSSLLCTAKYGRALLASAETRCVFVRPILGLCLRLHTQLTFCGGDVSKRMTSFFPLFMFLWRFFFSLPVSVSPSLSFWVCL